MLKIDRIENFEEFLKLEPIWNTLLARSDMDIPYMTFEWFSFWWKRYGKQSKMVILLLKDENELLAIAPLMQKKIIWRGLFLTAICFIANYHSNRTGLIIGKYNKAIFVSILEYLKNCNYRFDMLIFNLIEKNSNTDNLLREALNINKLKHKEIRGDFSPRILIDQTWECYLKGRSKSLQKNLRYRKNLLVQEGGYEIVVYSQNEISKAMEELLQVSRNSSQYERNRAIASDYDSTTFHASLSELSSKKGWLQICILRLKNRPIAFEYKLKYKERIYLLKVGYDKKYSRLGPGITLLSYSIKDAYESNCKEYDFLGVNEPHKLEWASSCRIHCKYWIFNDTLYGQFLYFWESVIITTIKKILVKLKLKKTWKLN